MTLPHLLVGPFAGFLEWLLRASLSATGIAAVIVLIQLLLGRWLTPAWRYRLWAVMVIRLLLPVLPASPASISNFKFSSHIGQLLSLFHRQGPGTRALREPTSDVSTQNEPTAPKITVVYGPAPQAAVPLHQTPAKVASVHTPQPFQHLPIILFGAWLAGILIFSLRLIGANILLSRRLRDAVMTQDAALLERFADCCRRAGIRRPPALLITDAVRIPATAGLWRPRILLPPGLFDGLSDQQQRSVLLHELAHVKCRDVLSNWILAAAQIIHWFNPAIRWSIARLKVDREMARDAMVLRWIGVDDDATVGREQYARTLLNLTESLSAGPRCLGMAAGLAGICTPAGLFPSGGFGRSSALKRRLQMIRTADQKVRRSTLLGALLAAALVGCTLTRAQDAPAPRPASAPAANPPSQAAEERQVGPSDKDDMLVAEARALITSHKYDEALTVLKEIRAENPRSKYLAEVEPTLLRQIKDERRLAKATEDEVQKQLDRILPELSFDGVALSDVIDFLRDISGANIFVNWKTLEAAGIERKAPITARLRNIRFSKALGILLDAASGGGAKLGYSTDDGVIEISTADDLAKNVQVRVYDVRDLLAVPPDFVPSRLGTPRPAGAAGPTTEPSAKTNEQQLREQAVKDLVQMIEQTVATDSWKDRGGSVGALRELQGQLIVTQTFENHIQIMRLLQQMRESRGLQCTIECRFISCDEPVARALLAKWQKIATPATRRATAGGATTASPGESERSDHGSSAVGLFLNEEQVAQFLKADQDAPKLSEIGAPRLTLFNGQRAYVMISTSHRYTSGYAAVAAPGGQTRYDPVQSVVESGVLLDVQATVSADRDATTVSLYPQVSALLGMKRLPWIGGPAGSNLMIQEPQIRSTELHTAVSVPVGRTLLIGGLEDPRVAPGSGPATQPGKPLRSLFLLVRPTIILGAEQPPSRDQVLHTTKNPAP